MFLIDRVLGIIEIIRYIKANMSDKKTVYNKCINCGKYIEIETEIKDKSLFCGNECYEKYSCCNICSQYYNIEKTHEAGQKANN
jgi:predicted transglutaminase-like protease